VDTSAYHVADAFSVPTVAIFSTVNPELRARYYPTVECVVLPGTGSSVSGDLPRAGDLLSAWPRLDLNKVVELLAEQMPVV
jgi:ADP-heptose:LPS heptosyltransferase